MIRSSSVKLLPRNVAGEARNKFSAKGETKCSQTWVLYIITGPSACSTSMPCLRHRELCFEMLAERSTLSSLTSQLRYCKICFCILHLHSRGQAELEKKSVKFHKSSHPNFQLWSLAYQWNTSDVTADNNLHYSALDLSAVEGEDGD